MISLRCEDCLGIMEVDENREIFTCPYCGSKKILPISDEVKIAKIKSDIDIKKMEIEKDEKARTFKMSVIILIACFAILIMCFLAIFLWL